MPNKLPAPEFVRSILREGVRHTEQMLTENQRLREAERASGAAVSRLHAELDASRTEVLQARDERRQLEERQTALSSLHAASSELHARLEVDSVLETLKEIIINLLGSESFGIYLVGQRRSSLRISVEVGVPPLAPRTLEFGHGAIGRSVLSDRPWTESAQAAGDDPIVVIPLRVHELVVGTIAIFGFLKQKKGVTDLDRELFGMLSAQAATALHCAALYTKESRRAATFEGLIDLVRSGAGKT